MLPGTTTRRARPLILLALLVMCLGGIRAVSHRPSPPEAGTAPGSAPAQESAGLVASVVGKTALHTDALPGAKKPPEAGAAKLPEGGERLEYDCVRDFSSVQGKQGWHWQSYAPDEGYRDLRFTVNPRDAHSRPYWIGPPASDGLPCPTVRPGDSLTHNAKPGYLGVQPGDCTGRGDAVIAWRAPAAGTVAVAGEVLSNAFNGYGGTDGFDARLLIAGSEAWRADLPDGERSEAIPPMVASVEAGQFVRLHLGAKEDRAYDGAWVRLHITLAPAEPGRSPGPHAEGR